MHKTKIDYANYTMNPVWGCRNNCPYCYARAIAKRWGHSFEPHWMERNFNLAMPKEPARIFVNSMSDVMYWTGEWWERVLDRIFGNPQHTFIFLTQDPREYLLWQKVMTDNCWLGATVTTEAALMMAQKCLAEIKPSLTTFLSIEPILEPIDLKKIAPGVVDWVILGAETGNRQGRVIPPAAWIQPFLELEVPLFMKHNLPWSGPWRKEFPA